MLACQASKNCRYDPVSIASDSVWLIKIEDSFFSWAEVICACWPVLSLYLTITGRCRPGVLGRRPTKNLETKGVVSSKSAAKKHILIEVSAIIMLTAERVGYKKMDFFGIEPPYEKFQNPFLTAVAKAAA